MSLSRSCFTNNLPPKTLLKALFISLSDGLRPHAVKNSRKLRAGMVRPRAERVDNILNTSSYSERQNTQK